MLYCSALLVTAEGKKCILIANHIAGNGFCMRIFQSWNVHVLCMQLPATGHYANPLLANALETSRIPKFTGPLLTSEEQFSVSVPLHAYAMKHAATNQCLYSLQSYTATHAT